MKKTQIAADIETKCEYTGQKIEELQAALANKKGALESQRCGGGSLSKNASRETSRKAKKHIEMSSPYCSGKIKGLKCK